MKTRRKILISAMKTANALGIKIAPAFLTRVNKVFE